jgi:hypothetical protein
MSIPNSGRAQPHEQQAEKQRVCETKNQGAF